MSDTKTFWEQFNSKAFSKAQETLSNLNSTEAEEILATLFQQSQTSKQPHSVSVLYRRLHPGKTFEDFYKAWMPAEDKCNPVTVAGQQYQQFFSAPIRVVNAVNMSDPTDIVSVGQHWITDEQLESMYNDPVFLANGAERGERIAKVADKEQTGVYKIVSDDNLGTAF